MVLVGAPLLAQTPAPDNTRNNARDRQITQKTAGDQKNNRADLERTRQIRRAIVKDKGLSTSAHNVKVVTSGGKVMLKGPVRTETEKTAVEAKAAEVAGKGNVMSEVSITDKPVTDKPAHERRHKHAKKGRR
jgi:osmotically-inducible protein OsmY